MAWTICSSVPVTFLDTTGEPTNHSVAFPKATYSFVLCEIRRDSMLNVRRHWCEVYKCISMHGAYSVVTKCTDVVVLVSLS